MRGGSSAARNARSVEVRWSAPEALISALQQRSIS